MKIFRSIYDAFMNALVWMMKLVHNTVGITIPSAKFERHVAVLWVVVTIGMVAMTMALGYFFITTIASNR